jgi:hypothetical protein
VRAYWSALSITAKSFFHVSKPLLSRFVKYWLIQSGTDKGKKCLLDYRQAVVYPTV